MNKIITRFSLVVLLGVLSMSSARAQIKLNGAGATFPFPIYSKWFSVYKGAQVNYQPVGSGAGINQIKARTLDFGASDYPIFGQELLEMPAPIVQMPTVGAPIAVIYNGMPHGLRFSGELIADIFLGKVTRWNDARLQVLNPSVKLPDKAISVIRRSDGSGTSFIFTQYLSSVSREWKTKIGVGKAVAWPVGLGGRGCDGVSAMAKSTPGAFSFVELAFAVQQNLPYAAVRNRDGQFVMPTSDGVSHAIRHFLPVLQRDLRTPIVNARGAKSYPISGLTYLLFYRRQADSVKGRALFNLLRWINTRGQSYAKPLYYAPLPFSLQRINSRKISEVEKASASPPTMTSSTR